MSNTNQILEFEQMKYVLRFPKGYKEGDKCPLIIFLHGAGTRSDDIKALLGNVFLTITESYENFPFITVAPLCNKNSWFSLMSKLIDFVKYLHAQDFTDKERIYLTGNSMGGYGTWELAMTMPEYFSAIVPICGGGMYWNAERLKKVPVWAFHGEKDPVVLARESEVLVNAVNRFGGNAKLTLYPDLEHDCWTTTYSNKEVFSWLLSNSKSE
jgi:predicted peptidase